MKNGATDMGEVPVGNLVVYTDHLPRRAEVGRMLAELKRVDEVKDFRDKALAAALYAKAAKDRSLEVDAAEYRLRAERRMGQLLREQVVHEGGRPADKRSDASGRYENGSADKRSDASDRFPTLEALGVSKNQSSEWQQVAAIPETKFEDACVDSRMANKPIKAADLLRDSKRDKIMAALEEVNSVRVKELLGVYDVFVIDPPWPIQKIERDVRKNQVAFAYPTMSLKEIAAEVGEMLNLHAATNCHVFVWTTQKFLPQTFILFEKWQLSYNYTFTWCKPGGYQPTGQAQFDTEFVVYGHRGTPLFVDTKEFGLWFEGARGEHSEKPEEFYDVLRRVTAGRRLDMYNRRVIEGFDGWGKESPQDE